MTALQFLVLVAVVAGVWGITYALERAAEKRVTKPQAGPLASRVSEFAGFMVEEHKRGQVIDAPTLIQRLKASKGDK